MLILLGLRHAGPALVVNQPQRSDVILLLAGDADDTRYWKGIELLRAGYAPRMLVDARADAVSYGRTPAELTEDFIRRSAGGLARPCLPDQGHIHAAGIAVGGGVPAAGRAAQHPAGHLRLPHPARALDCAQGVPGVLLVGGGGKQRIAVGAALVDGPRDREKRFSGMAEGGVVGAGGRHK